jgi:hypothetical protein
MTVTNAGDPRPVGPTRGGMLSRIASSPAISPNRNDIFRTVFRTGRYSVRTMSWTCSG